MADGGKDLDSMTTLRERWIVNGGYKARKEPMELARQEKPKPKTRWERCAQGLCFVEVVNQGIHDNWEAAWWALIAIILFECLHLRRLSTGTQEETIKIQGRIIETQKSTIRLLKTQRAFDHES